MGKIDRLLLIFFYLILGSPEHPPLISEVDERDADDGEKPQHQHQQYDPEESCIGLSITKSYGTLLALV